VGGITGSNAGLDIPMAHVRFQSDQEMSSQVGAVFVAMIAAVKPYVAPLLIVTVLLSIWIGLRAN
jgi:hypothetical protein